MLRKETESPAQDGLTFGQEGVYASPENAQDRSLVRASCMRGSVRGTPSNRRTFRELSWVWIPGSRQRGAPRN